MPQIFANPNLPNYFVEAPEVTSAETARSFVAEYEQAKVIAFPNLRASIDTEFWGALDTDAYPDLKKFGANVEVADEAEIDRHYRILVARRIDRGLASALRDQFRAIYTALLPVYTSVFSNYSFDRHKVVWRLNTIMNENMHVDTYREENHQHFARMFVNLDSQPRIWQTSWPVEDMVERLRGRIPPSALNGKGLAEVWMKMNNSMFGKSSKGWWDDQPRHVAYFAPGDVWIVDSRQVAHQIFYGRRALSIDFSLPKKSMLDPSRHYLAFAERFRDEELASAA